MHKVPPPYTAYMLRIWPADTTDDTAWRASLESPRTDERRGFSSLEALFVFLKTQTEENVLMDETDDSSPETA